MGKLFYGTQSGMSLSVARQIKVAFDDLIDELVDIGTAKVSDFQNEEFLVLGGGTYGSGELTTDWERFWPQMDNIDFTGKKVALFALGDAWAYGDNFCSAMRIMYDKVIERGGEIVGYGESADEYDFKHSEAVIDGVFIGAALDEMNDADETPHRIADWSMTVREQLARVAI